MPAPLVAALSSVETALITTAGAANNAAGGLGLFNNALGRTVQLIDPGLWVFLERVMLDLQGTIGHIVSPGFEFLGRILRKVADINATLIPYADKFWILLEPSITKVINLVDKLGRNFIVMADLSLKLLTIIEHFETLTTSLDSLANIIEFLDHVIVTSEVLVEKLADALGSLFSGNLEEFKKKVMDDSYTAWGLAGERIAKKLEDSIGIGGRKASYTNFEEFGRQARISSYQLGRGPRTIEQIGEDQLGQLQRLNMTAQEVKNQLNIDRLFQEQRKRLNAGDNEVVRIGLLPPQNINAW